MLENLPPHGLVFNNAFVLRLRNIFGFKMGLVARELDNPYINHWVQNFRKYTGHRSLQSPDSQMNRQTARKEADGVEDRRREHILRRGTRHALSDIETDQEFAGGEEQGSKRCADPDIAPGDFRVRQELENESHERGDKENGEEKIHRMDRGGRNG